uniref:U2-Liphistoxin-Lth1a_1 n=1 Tax=Liphistius thaleban TaxID=1905330 RepID=A0A4Q8K5D7_9ARAC
MNRRQSTRGVCRRSAQMNSLPLFVSLWMVVVASSPRGFVGDPCRLPPEAGPCYASFPRFYHAGGGQCRPFVYGGCRGNQNNFQTLEECRATCAGRGHFRG